MTGFCASAQMQVEKMLKYTQPVFPQLIDNYHYSVYYTNNKNAYNLKGFQIASPGGAIQSVKVNPAGYSYALLAGKWPKTKVTVHALNSASIKRQINGLVSPSALCYTPDSRRLIVADMDVVKFFDSKSLVQVGGFHLGGGTPLSMTVSNNGYYIAIVYPARVDVYDLEGGKLRHSFPTPEGTCSVAFTETGGKVGLLSPRGTLTIYSTADFKPLHTFTDIDAGATGLFFHPDENYAAYVDRGLKVNFVNLFDPSDRPSIFEKGITDARFVRDNQNNWYLVTVADTDIRYRVLGGFGRNYAMMVNRGVEGLMAEWSRMRPGETEIEYRARVNEDAMREQRRIFAQQEATRLAGDEPGIGDTGISIGRYNSTERKLPVILGNGLVDIKLSVPPEDMATFGTGNKLQLQNPRYTLNADNKLELVYAKVFNPDNGKTYTYDNSAAGGSGMDLLDADASFVSLDLIMQSSHDDVILQDIKDNIVEEARQAKKISDYTTLKVNTRIGQEVDASGRNVKNYFVDFGYEVAPQGSATEDFAQGKYRIADSRAAESMLQVACQAFLNDFSGYIVPGKRLVVHITGSADAARLNGSLPYDGSLGIFVDEPCRVNGNLTAVTINPQQGIRSTEQLGFLRACAVQKELKMQLPELAKMRVEYRKEVRVAAEEGARYRTIGITFEFIDAF